MKRFSNTPITYLVKYPPPPTRIFCEQIMQIFWAILSINCTLEYRINGGGENNRGGWKWFDIIITGGWNNREGGAWRNRK